MKSAIFMLLLSVLMLSSCVTYTTPTDNNPIKQLTTFPINPMVKSYTRPPIQAKVDNNFTVSDEFVENSILLKKYSDAVIKWKTDNTIK